MAAGGCRVASERRGQEGGASGKVYLRGQQQGKTVRTSDKEVDEVLHVLQVALPQPVEITGKQVAPPQPVEDHTRADIYTTAHGGPHAGAGALKEAAVVGDPALEQACGRNCGPWGTHVGTDLF